MNELELTVRREQFCAAYGRALSDPTFRVQLQRQPGPAMAQFGFTLTPTAATLQPAWPSKWYVPEEPPPV
jgi:hypothetical protein